MKKWLRRGQLAKILGTTPPTVKYYTLLGLFAVRDKTQHGQHLYDPTEIVPRYTRIQELKRKRFTLQEIKDRLQIESVIEAG